MLDFATEADASEGLAALHAAGVEAELDQLVRALPTIAANTSSFQWPLENAQDHDIDGLEAWSLYDSIADAVTFLTPLAGNFPDLKDR